MIKRIDGPCFKNLIEYGVKNLSLHRTQINYINVFPVPDGDTGTNMVVTIKNGLAAINEPAADLSATSQKFAKSVVSGARGNSGVIVSQFLKGISETLSECESADAEAFVRSLEHGVQCAYASVAEPVEGTILTVINAATQAARRQCGPDSAIDDVIDVFIENAKLSLETTPDLLPMLKEAGVVDSGGSGVVYFFEGMKKYLDGEEIDAEEDDVETESAAAVDYSVFNKSSAFPFGYCTELLIQLLDGSEPFCYSDFKEQLNELGNSIVTSLDEDKVKVHIHTFSPETILTFCHKYGEFLALKIENMTVQHTEIAPKTLFAEETKGDYFSIVTLAATEALQQLFAEMGADAVVRSDSGLREDDLTEVFDRLKSKPILLFPNDERCLTAVQKAAESYTEADIRVVNSLSAADCYAALPMIDYYETSVDRVVRSAEKLISGVYTVKIRRRDNPAEYFAADETDVIAAEDALEKTAQAVLAKSQQKCENGIVTVFTGSADVQTVSDVFEQILSQYEDFEMNVVETNDMTYNVMISFE